MRSTSRYSILRVLMGWPPLGGRRSARQGQVHVARVGGALAAEVHGVQAPAARAAIAANLQRDVQAQQRAHVIRRGDAAAGVLAPVVARRGKNVAAAAADPMAPLPVAVDL